VSQALLYIYDETGRAFIYQYLTFPTFSHILLCMRVINTVISFTFSSTNIADTGSAALENLCCAGCRRRKLH